MQIQGEGGIGKDETLQLLKPLCWHEFLKSPLKKKKKKKVWKITNWEKLNPRSMCVFLLWDSQTHLASNTAQSVATFNTFQINNELHTQTKRQDRSVLQQQVRKKQVNKVNSVQCRVRGNIIYLFFNEQKERLSTRWVQSLKRLSFDQQGH